MVDNKVKALGAAALAFGLVVWLLGKGKAELGPADIQLSNLVISPTEVQVGQPVTISVDATNVGQTAGIYKMTLEVS